MGTPAGQPTPGELDPEGSYAAFQREVVALWCLCPSETEPCARLCPECRQEAQRRINAAYVAARPFESQTEPGRPYHHGPADIRVIDRDSEEGRRILAERAARRARDERPAADPALAALLAGGAL